MAQDADSQVEDSKDALDNIKSLVEDIKSRKLPEIVAEIGTLLDAEGYQSKSAVDSDKIKKWYLIFSRTFKTSLISFGTNSKKSRRTKMNKSARSNSSSRRTITPW